MQKISSIETSSIKALQAVNEQRTEAPKSGGGDFLSGFSVQWQRTMAQRDALVAEIPARVRPLIEAQMAVSRLELQTQVMTKAAEGISSTLRRMQQMGG